MIDQILHQRRLSGNHRSVQGRAAAPSRVAHSKIQQLIDVQGVIKKRVLRIAYHLVITEIRMRVDIVAQLERQLDGFEALRFRTSGERSWGLTLPSVQAPLRPSTA